MRGLPAEGERYKEEPNPGAGELDSRKNFGSASLGSDEPKEEEEEAENKRENKRHNPEIWV